MALICGKVKHGFPSLVGLHQGLCRVVPRQHVEQERAKVRAGGLAQRGALLQQDSHLCRASAGAALAEAFLTFDEAGVA